MHNTSHVRHFNPCTMMNLQLFEDVRNSRGTKLWTLKLEVLIPFWNSIQVLEFYKLNIFWHSQRWKFINTKDKPNPTQVQSVILLLNFTKTVLTQRNLIQVTLKTCATINLYNKIICSTLIKIRKIYKNKNVIYKTC